MIAEKLRKAVLQAAMEGKLTEQLSEDGNAINLIAQIKIQKENLVKLKKIRQDKETKSLENIKVEKIIPKNWVLTRLGEIANYKKGPFGSSLTKSMFVPKSDSSIKVYEQKNAIQKSFEIGDYYIKKQYYENKMTGFIVEPGDIIISCAGTIGEIYQLPLNAESGIINQALMRVRLFDGIDSGFFSYLFTSMLNEIHASSSGSAIKNIPPFSILKNILILLPPYKEQKRIVEKLEVLLAEIDKLEQDEKALKELEDKFPKKLKNAILQSAIEGKLASIQKSDVCSLSFLEQIKKTRFELVSKKENRNENEMGKIQSSEFIFDIPTNWNWIRLGDIASINTGVTFKKEEQSNNGIRILRGGSISNGQISIYDNDIFLPQEKVKTEHIVRKGDILTPSVTSIEHIGKVGIVKENSNKMAHGGFVFNIRPYLENYIFSKYIYYYIQSPKNIDKLRTLTNKSGQAFYNLGKEKFRNIVIPIPPINEQKHIVEELDKLFAIDLLNI